MEHTDFDGIIFADTLQDFNALRHTGRVIHILCSGGNMGFTFQDTRYHIAAGDYVILPNATLGSDFYNPQIQISAESETKRSIFRKRDKTKRSKKESAQHSKSRNKSFVMTSVSAL